MGTQFFWIANLFVEIKFLLSISIIVETTLSMVSKCLTIPIRPLISQSFVLTLTVEITFAPIFNLSILNQDHLFLTDFSFVLVIFGMVVLQNLLECYQWIEFQFHYLRVHSGVPHFEMVLKHFLQIHEIHTSDKILISAFFHLIHPQDLFEFY